MVCFFFKESLQTFRISKKILSLSDGFHVYLNSDLTLDTKPVRVYPVVVNVGINEQAISSNM